MSTRPATPAANPDSALIERQTRLLIDLAEIGMKAMRTLRIDDHTSADDVLKISLDFVRISKAIRQIVVLETEVAEGRLAELLRARAASDHPPRPEPLLDDLDDDDLDDDDLDEEDLDEAFLDEEDLDEDEDLSVDGRCFGEMVQVLCRTLDVPVPHDRLRAEDWVVVDAPVVQAPASPPRRHGRGRAASGGSCRRHGRRPAARRADG